MSREDLPSQPDDASELEFEAYVRRRRALFPRDDAVDSLEPSPDIDRAVLARARAAIHAEPPTSVYRGTRWALPVAIAATVVLAFTIVLNVGLPTRGDSAGQPAGEVSVQNAARAVPAESAEVADAAAAPAAAPQQTAPAGPAERRDFAPPPPPLLSDRSRAIEAPTEQNGMAERNYTARESELMATTESSAADIAPAAKAARAADASRALSELARQQGQAAASEAVPAADAQAGSAPPLSADAWWDRIERLRANGQLRVAAHELENFRLAYPDDPRLHELPAAPTEPNR
ncbi:MAG TPA: hypothetical protein P5528_02775 [Steroidobacteraceae bacterium]|nr:hypothetical protein [Steroidobacteraceae bacterium]